MDITCDALWFSFDEGIYSVKVTQYLYLALLQYVTEHLFTLLLSSVVESSIEMFVNNISQWQNFRGCCMPDHKDSHSGMDYRL